MKVWIFPRYGNARPMSHENIRRSGGPTCFRECDVTGKISTLAARPGDETNVNVPFKGLEPLSGDTTSVCDAWPVQTPDLRLPSQLQSISAHWPVPNYTACLLCMNDLPRVAARTATCLLQVQRPNHCGSEPLMNERTSVKCKCKCNVKSKLV